MAQSPLAEIERERRTERELAVLRATLEIVKIVKPFPCPERQDIERKVREIIQ